MHIVIAILGALEIIGGIGAYLAATTAFHEILAAVSFGLGIVAIGIAAMITAIYGVSSELRSIQVRIDAREAGDLDRHKDMKKISAIFDRIAQKQTERTVSSTPPA